MNTYIPSFLRFCAYLIDLFVLALLDMILAVLFSMTGIMRPFMEVSMHVIFFYLGLVLLNSLYYALLESSSWQASIGKRICGLQVVDQSGKRISFFKAAMRFFSVFISYITLCGHLMVFFTSKQCTLHDLISNTHVVLSKAKKEKVV